MLKIYITKFDYKKKKKKKKFIIFFFKNFKFNFFYLKKIIKIK